MQQKHIIRETERSLPIKREKLRMRRLLIALKPKNSSLTKIRILWRFDFQ
jgi:hypothetical protein